MNEKLSEGFFVEFSLSSALAFSPICIESLPFLALGNEGAIEFRKKLKQFRLWAVGSLWKLQSTWARRPYSDLNDS